MTPGQNTPGSSTRERASARECPQRKWGDNGGNQVALRRPSIEFCFALRSQLRK